MRIQSRYITIMKLFSPFETWTHHLSEWVLWDIEALSLLIHSHYSSTIISGRMLLYEEEWFPFSLAIKQSQIFLIALSSVDHICLFLAVSFTLPSLYVYEMDGIGNFATWTFKGKAFLIAIGIYGRERLYLFVLRWLVVKELKTWKCSTSPNHCDLPGARVVERGCGHNWFIGNLDHTVGTLW